MKESCNFVKLNYCFLNLSFLHAKVWLTNTSNYIQSAKILRQIWYQCVEQGEMHRMHWQTITCNIYSWNDTFVHTLYTWLVLRIVLCKTKEWQAHSFVKWCVFSNIYVLWTVLISEEPTSNLMIVPVGLPQIGSTFSLLCNVTTDEDVLSGLSVDWLSNGIILMNTTQSFHKLEFPSRF